MKAAAVAVLFGALCCYVATHLQIVPGRMKAGRVEVKRSCPTCDSLKTKRKLFEIR